MQLKVQNIEVNLYSVNGQEVFSALESVQTSQMIFHRELNESETRVPPQISLDIGELRG